MRVSVKKNYKIYGSKGLHLIYRIIIAIGKPVLFDQPPLPLSVLAAYMPRTRTQDQS